MANRISIPAWLVAALMAMGSAPAQQQRKTLAVLIGTGQYSDNAIDFLKYADRDAASFQQHIRTQRSATDPQPIVLINGNATRGKILDALRSTLPQASPNTDVYIFISARGESPPGRNEGYIQTYDSAREKVDSTIKISDLRALVQQSSARVFLFADVCRESSEPRLARLEDNRINIRLQDLRQIKSPPLQGFLGSEPNHESKTDDHLDGGHGVFSFFLVNGLQGKGFEGQRPVITSDGKVTASAVFDYLRKQVMARTGAAQKPLEFSNGKDLANLALSDLKRVGVATLARPEFRELGLRLAFFGQAAPGALAAQNARLAEDFSKALAGGNLLGKNSASEIFPKLSAEDRDRLRSSLATALEDQGQRVIVRYGTGDQFPTTGYGSGGPAVEKLLRLTPEDFEQARAAFEAAQTLRPGDRSLQVRGLFCKGKSLLFANKRAEALDALTASLKIDERFPESLNARGIIYLESRKPGDLDIAAANFRDAIRYSPDWAYPRHNLALTYIEQGAYAAAEREYRLAIERTRYYPYLYYNLGLLLQRLNKLKAAEQEYLAADRVFDHQVARYEAHGKTWRDAKEIEQSDRAFAQAKELTRNWAEVFNALGSLRQAQGRQDDAAAAYVQALQKNSFLVPAQHNLAIIYSQESKPDEAIALWKKNIAVDPAFHPSLLKLGETYLLRRHYSEAEKYYRAVLQVQEHNVEARAGLADSLSSQGKANDAIGELEQAIRDRATPVLYAKLGDLYWRQGQRERACVEFDAARKSLKGSAKDGEAPNLKSRLASCAH